MWSWNGALPRRGWKSKTTTRVISTTDHHRAAKTRSTNRSKGGRNGITQSGSYLEFPSAVSGQRLGYHKADGLRDVTSLFLCQGTSTGLLGSAHSHTQPLSKARTSWQGTQAQSSTPQPPGAFCSPEIPSCSPAAGLDSITPSGTPGVSFWETAGLVPGCLTPSDLLLHSCTIPSPAPSASRVVPKVLQGQNLPTPNSSQCNALPWLDKASWRLGNAEFGF